jgi:hypothetical protein
MIRPLTLFLVVVEAVDPVAVIASALDGTISEVE